MSLRGVWGGVWHSLINGWTLRTVPAERWMVWGVPIVVVAALAAASQFALIMGWTLFPYAAAVGAVAIISNRVCVRSGLLTATLAAFTFNYLFALADPIGPLRGIGMRLHLHVPTAPELTAWVTMYVVALFVAPRRNSSPPGPRVFDDGRDLPFTRQSNGESDPKRSLFGNGVVFWDPPTPATYEEGIDIGTAYGNMLISRVRNGEPRPCMAWMVRDMVARGLERYGAIEIGFLQTITAASRAALIANRGSLRQ